MPGTSSDIPFLYIPTAAWHPPSSVTTRHSSNRFGSALAAPSVGIGRIADGTLVTGGIGIERIEILHVRLPCFCQSLLLILYSQTVGQFKNDIVYEFVVQMMS